MFVYQFHKIRVASFIILSFFLVSIFSVFLLQTDVICDNQSTLQPSVKNPWLKIFSNDLYDDEDGKDYDEYGPADIISVDDTNDEYDSEMELMNENAVFSKNDFDWLNLNEGSKGRFVERKLRAKKSVDDAAWFVVPSDYDLQKASESFDNSKAFWPEYLEDIMPKGAGNKFTESYLHKLQTEKITRAQPPTWDRCGRPKNQFLTLANGQHVCARYRDPHNYLVIGEVLSFYLSRLLGIQNTPVVTLSKVTTNSKQWSVPAVRRQLKVAGWKMNTTVALIQWVDGLERSRMPWPVLNALTNSQPIDSHMFNQYTNLTNEDMVELMQWTDLIVFDYITGHYDRVASMQDAAEKEQRQSVLEESVHNLAKSQADHGLWLIDNESGILDGYSLIYSPQSSSSSTNSQSKSSSDSDDNVTGNFLKFHEEMLNSTCIFRRSTANRISWLVKQENPLKVLVSFVKMYEPYFSDSDKILSDKNLVVNFKSRILNVFNKIKLCDNN